MDEYWDIVDYEYDSTGNGVPAFIVIAKKKERNVPRKWMVTWHDADGVKMDVASREKALTVRAFFFLHVMNATSPGGCRAPDGSH